ncbi:MAG: hypothetical protein H6581_14805 [Bacteroidia bacterium]|nr:hypothetical protein [Bacteroidia bacterium]
MTEIKTTPTAPNSRVLPENNREISRRLLLYRLNQEFPGEDYHYSMTNQLELFAQEATTEGGIIGAMKASLESQRKEYHRDQIDYGRLITLSSEALGDSAKEATEQNDTIRRYIKVINRFLGKSLEVQYSHQKEIGDDQKIAFSWLGALKAISDGVREEFHALVNLAKSGLENNDYASETMNRLYDWAFIRYTDKKSATKISDAIEVFRFALQRALLQDKYTEEIKPKDYEGGGDLNPGLRDVILTEKDRVAKALETLKKAEEAIAKQKKIERKGVFRRFANTIKRVGDSETMAKLKEDEKTKLEDAFKVVLPYHGFVLDADGKGLESAWLTSICEAIKLSLNILLQVLDGLARGEEVMHYTTILAEVAGMHAANAEKKPKGQEMTSARHMLNILRDLHAKALMPEFSLEYITRGTAAALKEELDILDEEMKQRNVAIAKIKAEKTELLKQLKELDKGTRRKVKRNTKLAGDKVRKKKIMNLHNDLAARRSQLIKKVQWLMDLKLILNKAWGMALEGKEEGVIPMVRKELQNQFPLPDDPVTGKKVEMVEEEFVTYVMSKFRESQDLGGNLVKETSENLLKSLDDMEVKLEELLMRVGETEENITALVRAIEASVSHLYVELIEKQQLVDWTSVDFQNRIKASVDEYKAMTYKIAEIQKLSALNQFTYGIIGNIIKPLVSGKETASFRSAFEIGLGISFGMTSDVVELKGLGGGLRMCVSFVGKVTDDKRLHVALACTLEGEAMSKIQVLSNMMKLGLTLKKEIFHVSRNYIFSGPVHFAAWLSKEVSERLAFIYAYFRGEGRGRLGIPTREQFQTSGEEVAQLFIKKIMEEEIREGAGGTQSKDLTFATLLSGREKAGDTRNTPKVQKEHLQHLEPLLDALRKNKTFSREKLKLDGFYLRRALVSGFGVDYLRSYVMDLFDLLGGAKIIALETQKEKSLPKNNPESIGKESVLNLLEKLEKLGNDLANADEKLQDALESGLEKAGQLKKISLRAPTGARRGLELIKKALNRLSLSHGGTFTWADQGGEFFEALSREILLAYGKTRTRKKENAEDGPLDDLYPWLLTAVADVLAAFHRVSPENSRAMFGAMAGKNSYDSFAKEAANPAKKLLNIITGLAEVKEVEKGIEEDLHERIFKGLILPPTGKTEEESNAKKRGILPEEEEEEEGTPGFTVKWLDQNSEEFDQKKYDNCLAALEEILKETEVRKGLGKSLRLALSLEENYSAVQRRFSKLNEGLDHYFNSLTEFRQQETEAFKYMGLKVEDFVKMLQDKQIPTENVDLKRLMKMEPILEKVSSPNSLNWLTSGWRLNMESSIGLSGSAEIRTIRNSTFVRTNPDTGAKEKSTRKSVNIHSGFGLQFGGTIYDELSLEVGAQFNFTDITNHYNPNNNGHYITAEFYMTFPGIEQLGAYAGDLAKKILEGSPLGKLIHQGETISREKLMQLRHKLEKLKDTKEIMKVLELRKLAEEKGKQILKDNKENLDNLKESYDKVKEKYDQVKGVYDKVVDTKEMVQETFEEWKNKPFENFPPEVLDFKDELYNYIFTEKLALYQDALKEDKEATKKQARVIFLREKYENDVPDDLDTSMFQKEALERIKTAFNRLLTPLTTLLGGNIPHFQILLKREGLRFIPLVLRLKNYSATKLEMNMGVPVSDKGVEMYLSGAVGWSEETLENEILLAGPLFPNTFHYVMTVYEGYRNRGNDDPHLLFWREEWIEFLVNQHHAILYLFKTLGKQSKMKEGKLLKEINQNLEPAGDFLAACEEISGNYSLAKELVDYFREAEFETLSKKYGARRGYIDCCQKMEAYFNAVIAEQRRTYKWVRTDGKEFEADDLQPVGNQSVDKRTQLFNIPTFVLEDVYLNNTSEMPIEKIEQIRWINEQILKKGPFRHAVEIKLAAKEEEKTGEPESVMVLIEKRANAEAQVFAMGRKAESMVYSKIIDDMIRIEIRKDDELDDLIRKIRKVEIAAGDLGMEKEEPENDPGESKKTPVNLPAGARVTQLRVPQQKGISCAFHALVNAKLVDEVFREYPGPDFADKILGKIDTKLHEDQVLEWFELVKKNEDDERVEYLRGSACKNSFPLLFPGNPKIKFLDTLANIQNLPEIQNFKTKEEYFHTFVLRLGDNGGRYVCVSIIKVKKYLHAFLMDSLNQSLAGEKHIQALIKAIFQEEKPIAEPFVAADSSGLSLELKFYKLSFGDVFKVINAISFPKTGFLDSASLQEALKSSKLFDNR